MKILVVLTSHDTLGDTGKKTGFWLEELAAPYYTFKDAGVELTLASPKGGQPPLDPKAMTRPPRPTRRAASTPMRRPRLNSRRRASWPTCPWTTTTPCSTRAAMARYGISPRICIRSA